MTNYNFTGKEISKKLDTKTIKKGGLVMVTMPVAKVSNEIDTIEFGGYRSLVNYNKNREQEHKDIKFQKKMRSLRRNIKNRGLRQSGLTLHTGATRDFKT